jgi:CheY-like chemotaxis protein
MMTPVKFRRILLGVFLIPISIVTSLFEYNDYGDSALLLYFYCSFFLTANIFMWSLWAYFSRLRPTFMFYVNLALMGSLDFVILANTYARWKFVTYPELYQHVIGSDWWAYRVAPELLVFVWLFAWTVSRFWLGEEVPMKKGDRLRVLIIEDDHDISNLMHQVIDSMKAFSVDRAYTYSEALTMFSPNKYVCVTLDLNLGNSIKEGIDLSEKFRKEDPDVFIAIISGYFDQVFDDRLLNSVDDFIQKPFSPEVFKLKMFLWAVKYRRRVYMKKHIEGSDFQIKSEVLEVLDEKIQEMYVHTK